MICQAGGRGGSHRNIGWYIARRKACCRSPSAGITTDAKGGIPCAVIVFSSRTGGRIARHETFDDFLNGQGLLAEAEERAIKERVAEQIRAAMAEEASLEQGEVWPNTFFIPSPSWG